MAVPASRAAADVLRDYQAAIQDSDRAIRAAGDPDARLCPGHGMTRQCPPEP